MFFLVCAAVQPDTGRKQQIPSSETVEKESEDEKHLEVEIDRARLLVGGEPAKFEEFPRLLAARLPKRDRPEEERVVVVKSKPEVPYQRWIEVTTQIEQAGGVITLQLEEEREVMVPE